MDQEKWLQLRQTAQKLVEAGTKAPGSEEVRELQTLLEELNIASVELEIQNKELQETLVLLENLTKEYSDLFDFSPIGKILVSESGQLEKVNLTFAGLVKAIRSRVVGTSLNTWLDSDSMVSTRERLQRAAHDEARASTMWSAVLMTAKRERIPVRMIARKAVGSMEGRLYVVVIDESEQKALEEGYSVLQERARNTRFMESLGNFATGIAHDFNNILASIMGYTQVALLGQAVEPRLQGYLNEILSASRRGKLLIEHTMSFGKLGLDTLKETDIKALVEERLEACKKPDSENVSVHLDVRSASPVILAPPAQLGQAIQQLLLNAFEAMKAGGGSLHIVVEDRTYEEIAPLPLSPPPAKGDYLYLSVRDTGPGIEAKHLDRIYEPFYSTKEHNAGKGLGLFVVYGVVTGMGGSILTQSSPGRGTQVHLFLPKKSIDLSNTRSDQAPFGALEGCRVLYLDYDPMIAALFREFFEIFRIESRIYTDPRLLMEDVHREPDWADLVLSDLNLGEYNGLEILTLLKHQHPAFKVALTTGFLDDKAREELFKKNGLPILPKPYEIEDVYRFLKAQLLEGDSGK